MPTKKKDDWRTSFTRPGRRARQLEIEREQHYPPLMFEVDPHQFSWLREVVVPAIFVALGAVLGAGLGLLASERLEKQKSKRDEDKAKHDKDSFLHAIGMELDALGDQLDVSLQEVKESTERVKSGTGPQFAAALRTSVFTSQLAKVRDVDDPLMIQVIHFYSDLGTIQQVIESVNNLSTEYNTAELSGGHRRGAQTLLLSGLSVLQEKMTGFGKRLRDLRAKLPQSEKPT
jgi:hypothetical protein